MTILTGVLGIAVLIGLAVLLSDARDQIRLRTVAGAFALQAGLATFLLYVPWGVQVLRAVVYGVGSVIGFAGEGIDFVFGGLAAKGIGFTIAVHVLPVIVFFAALMSTLYYLRIMQPIISIGGGLLQRVLGTSRPESMSAVANIFVGHTEAPLVVRPYLERMSPSELFAVMTGGTATIAGAVMAGYAAMGIELEYLVTASFMAAPGGLLMAKIIKPETGEPSSTAGAIEYSEGARPANVFEAIGNGAADGLRIGATVGAMLIAFVSMVALLNGIIGGVGGWLGYGGITLQDMLGILLQPLGFLLGVPWDEAATVGSLIGQKFVLNEFYAYANLVQVSAELSPRTLAIVTFALCGFANLSAIAMFLGALGTIVPTRRQEIARLGLRAVVAGTLSNLMSATLAGLLWSLGSGP